MGTILDLRLENWEGLWLPGGSTARVSSPRQLGAPPPPPCVVNGAAEAKTRTRIQIGPCPWPPARGAQGGFASLVWVLLARGKNAASFPGGGGAGCGGAAAGGDPSSELRLAELATASPCSVFACHSLHLRKQMLSLLT